MVEVKVAGADEVPTKVRMLVTGASGVGKTRFALTAPNPIWASTGSGLGTLSLYDDSVPYVNIESEKDLYRLKVALEANAEEREELFGRPVDTLVVDSVDGLQRRFLTNKLKELNRSDIRSEDWNWLSQRFHAIFTGLSQLDLHLIVISHIKDVGFEDDHYIRPNVVGAFGDQIHEYVDFAFWQRANTVDKNKQEDPLGEGERKEPNFVTEAFFVTKPTLQAEWVHDYAGQLPFHFDLNFEDDFDSIQATLSTAVAPSLSFEVDETVTLKVDVDEVPKFVPDESEDKPEETPGQLASTDTKPVQKVTCTVCDKPVTSTNLIQLAKTRAHGEVRCLDHLDT